MTALTTREQTTQIVRGGGMGPGLSRPMPAQPPGLTGKDLLRCLRRRKWLILLSVGLFTGIAVAATALWLAYSPLYTTSAFMDVKIPENILDPRSAGYYNATSEIERRQQTMATLALQPSILQKVCAHPRVQATTWYTRDPVTAPDRLAEDVSVRPQVDTSLIRIEMTGHLKGELPEIVNPFCDVLRDHMETQAKTDQAADSTKLEDELKTIDTALSRVRKDMEGLRHEEAPSLQRTLDLLTQQMQKLKDQQLEYEGFQARTQQQLNDFTQQEREGLLDNSSDVAQSLMQDPLLRAMQNEQITQQAAGDALLQKFGREHIFYKEHAIRLQSLQKQIDDRTRNIRDSVLRLRRSQLESDLQAIQNRLVALQSSFMQAQRRSDELQRILARLTQLAADEHDLLERRKVIERSLTNLRLAKGFQPLQVYAQATEPKEPSMPRWIIMVPAGVLLGLAIGVGLALLLELMDTSVKSPTDVSRRIDLPLLGVVPHTHDLDEEIEDLHLAFMTNPNSLIGEAFRQIRTTLMFSGPAGQNRTLLVTSPQPGDGRGTVALNLAAAMAHGGRRVLVVDANFRQPMIRRVLPNCPESGLSNALVGQGNWQDWVHQVEPNLHVMSSGPLPPNPSELLGSDHMRNLLAEMGEKYDHVLFDGAPCLLVSDAAILGTLVDGVILVVRAGANTHGVVQRSRDSLRRVGAHILGVVLNGIRVTAGGYLRENYRTFYEYHEADALP